AHLRIPPRPESPSPRSGRTRNSSSLLPGALIAAACYGVQRAVLEPEGSQLPTPHAAAIQARQAFGHLEAKRRPVTEKKALLLFRTQVEPRPKTLGCFRALRLEIHLSFRRAKTHSRHRVHDDTQPIPALQAVAPFVGLAAV